MLLLLVAVACLCSALYFLSEFVTAPVRERRNLVTRATEYGRMRVSHGRELPRFRGRVVAPFVGGASRLMLRVNPKASLEGVTAKLMAAGMRNTSPAGFLAAQAALAVGGVLFGLVIMSSSPSSTGFLAVLVFGVGGFIAPSFFVSTKGRRRQSQVSADLPDALDLLAVSVEAGMGFDGAVEAHAGLDAHGQQIERIRQIRGDLRLAATALRRDEEARCDEPADAEHEHGEKSGRRRRRAHDHEPEEDAPDREGRLRGEEAGGGRVAHPGRHQLGGDTLERRLRIDAQHQARGATDERSDDALAEPRQLATVADPHPPVLGGAGDEVPALAHRGGDELGEEVQGAAETSDGYEQQEHGINL